MYKFALKLDPHVQTYRLTYSFVIFEFVKEKHIMCVDDETTVLLDEKNLKRSLTAHSVVYKLTVSDMLCVNIAGIISKYPSTLCMYVHSS